MTLKINIRQMRTARGLTIAALADMVGISTPHMSEVERGKKNLNNHLLSRIAAALQVQPSDLIDDGRPPEVTALSELLARLTDVDRARVEAFARALVASEQAAGQDQ